MVAPCLYPYRYGFNGKENDKNIATTGDGAQDYGMRIYNPALGKFLSIDPLTKKYAMLTPYQFASNTPIMGSDLDGKELDVRIISRENGKTKLEITDDAVLNQATWVLPKMAIDRGDKSVEGAGANGIWAFDFTKTGIYAYYIFKDEDGKFTTHTYSPGEVEEALKVSTESIERIAAFDIMAVYEGGGKSSGSLKGGTREPISYSSRAARRQAMRERGIPTSQQPVSQSKNAAGREYTYEMSTEYGGKQMESVQQQTMDRSHVNQPHWEAGPVKLDKDGGVRTNNYGRPKIQNEYKTKVDYLNPEQ